MKSYKFIYLVNAVLILTALSGCKREEYHYNEFPQLTTMAASNISESGATFQAEFLYLGYDITNMGFYWGILQDMTMNSDSISSNNQNSKNSFSAEINYALPMGNTIYYRAFIQTPNFRVLGNIESFVSLGSQSPVVSSITPNHGLEGDTLVISGDNFTATLSKIEVTFGGLPGVVLYSAKEKIYVEIPQNYPTPGTVPVKVKIFDKDYPVGNFVLDSLKIIEINNTTAFPALTELELTFNGVVNSIDLLKIGQSNVEEKRIYKNRVRFIVPPETPAGISKISAIINKKMINSDWGIEIISPWTKKADCPDKSSFNITNSGFCLEGFAYYLIPNRYQSKNTIWKYSHTADTWEKIIDTNEAMRSSTFSFEIGNKGYFGAGSFSGYDHDGFNSFEFDPLNKTIKQINDFRSLVVTNADFHRLTSSFGMGADSVGFVIGGLISTIYPHIPFYKYSPQSETWARLVSINNAIKFRYWYGMTGFKIGNKIYVGTGVTETGLTREFWSYSPDDDSWSKLPDIPFNPRSFAIGFSINGKGYIGLGSTDKWYAYSSNSLSDLWEFTPETNTWQQVPSFPPGNRSGATSIIIDGKAYVGFGNEKNDLWEFNPTIYN